jgi:DNA polymerase III subunit delta
MTPDQFLRQLAKQGPAPAYLFLGAEAYQRRICRDALIAAALGDDDREQGFTQIDLDTTPLGAAMDDARSMSLFASRRLLWIAGAELALPRGRAAASDDSEDDGAPAKGAAGAVEEYVRDPAPATVVVFESSRFEFEGDDRAKLERVAKFYAAVSNVVEFRPFGLDAARALAQDLARGAGLDIGLGEIGLLVEALGGDAARIASEIEKLSLYAGRGRKITAADIGKLVPNAQESTIFELVAALGAGNRGRSLNVLDTLVREGEYLPLALSFLATQFRLALVAREARLRTAGDIQQHFTRIGVRMWRDRAEQVRQTVDAFPKEKLEGGLRKIFAADRALRDARPDDRIVMEELILSLTE